MKINGTQDPDEQDAADLFPHTTACMNNMRSSTVRHGKMVPCICAAKAGRRNFLYLIRRAKKHATVDAYAKIRRVAKARADRAQTPIERQAFEEVAAWAHDLELDSLEG